MKKRPGTPKRVSEAVLKEYHHRCSICGSDDPHLHHIDENPANNDPLNLLPLCPNCHLTDQHNPTSEIDPRILRLFREHRDPTILTPQFQPLFRRIEACLVDPLNDDDLEPLTNDLFRFVKLLAHGEYYSEAIHGLLSPLADLESNEELAEEVITTPNLALSRIRTDAYKLAVEMLRYQSWRVEPKSKLKSNG